MMPALDAWKRPVVSPQANQNVGERNRRGRQQSREIGGTQANAYGMARIFTNTLFSLLEQKVTERTEKVFERNSLVLPPFPPAQKKVSIEDNIF
jgi:hypothetical protein